jgi:hypothetical protein
MPAAVNRGDPVVVCLTPVKDERAVLPRFLDCAAMWADHIVVLDQCSTDGSREVAAAHPKVRLLLNDDPTYDEAGRQRTLLAAAREIPGRRVLVALDADEALSANVLHSRAWRGALSAEPGTVLRLRWASLLPGLQRAWISPDLIAFGLVDDGRDHRGPRIHSTRLPATAGQPFVALEDVRVLHYQFATRERNESKQRWYQCWERLHHPGKRPIQIYRQYHRLDAVPESEVEAVRPEWLRDYAEAGLDMTAVPPPASWYRWDEEVLDWVIEHGPSTFERLDIWEVDYEVLARRFGRDTNGVRLDDPRGAVTRAVHRLLALTQAHAGRRSVRVAQRALIPFGW